MPAELLLVNPRRKRRVKSKRVRARNPKRRRVTAKRRHKRRAIAVTTRTVVRRANPRRKSRRLRSRRRVNPRMLGGFSIKGITHALIPAAVGGAGAVALDIGLSYLPAATPEFLRSGIGNKALKIGGALLLGMVAGKVLGRETGRAVGAGALTVVAYGIVRDVVKQVAPTLPGLSGFGAYDNGDYALNPAPMLRGMGAYMDNGVADFQQAQVGAYMSNDGM